jgi:hypothetical protein
MFTHEILSILVALGFNAAPVSKLEVPAGDLGSFTFQGVRREDNSCGVVLRSNSGVVETLVANRTNSKENYDIFIPDLDRAPVASPLLPISSVPAGWSPQEVLITVKKETTVMMYVREFDSDNLDQDADYSTARKFIAFATCRPATCSCILEK